MLRALCLTMSLVVPPAYAPPQASADLGANAALKYWQAVAQLPKLTDAEQNKFLAEYLNMPLDAHAKELVAKANYSLQMMHQGAVLPRCDWGIGWKEGGIEVLLPQLSASRVLASLACLRARLRFEEGKNAEAVNDLIAAFAMSRQVSLDGSLIGLLVGYANEARVNDTVARYLPRLDAEAVRELKKRLDTLPAGNNPATALRTCEENTLDWFINKVKNQKEKDAWLAWAGPLFSERGDSPEKRAEKGRAFLAACGGTTDGVLKFAEETRPSYALLAKKLELPLEEFEKEFAAEQKRQAGNPVFKMFFPALSKCRHSQALHDIRRALLSAAIAVRLDGQDALKNHPDPVMGGSFEYVAFDGGFELRSKMKAGDKPLTLTVGPKKNEE
jgi:hypothetical protein